MCVLIIQDKGEPFRVIYLVIPVRKTSISCALACHCQKAFVGVKVTFRCLIYQTKRVEIFRSVDLFVSAEQVLMQRLPKADGEIVGSIISDR